MALTIGIHHQRHEPLKNKFNKLDFIDIKNFCSVKDGVKRVRKQATNCEKMLAKDISNKGLFLKCTMNS